MTICRIVNRIQKIVWILWFSFHALPGQSLLLAQPASKNEILLKNLSSGPLSTRLSQGIIFLNQKQFKAAESEFLSALRLSQNLEFHHLQPYIHELLGDTYTGLQQHDKIIESYTSALKNFSQPEKHLQIQYKLANFYYQEQSVPTALKVYQSALKLSQELADSSHTRILLGKIGDCYFRMNEISLAHLAHLKALDQTLNSANQELKIRYLLKVGTMFLEFGEYGQAQEFFQAAEQLNTILGNPQLNGAIHLKSGQLYQSANDTLQAKSHFIKALTIFQKNNAYVEEIETLLETGDLLIQMQNYEKALRLFQMALDLANRFRISEKLPRVYLGKAISCARLADFQQSHENFYLARRSISHYPEQPLNWKIHFGLGILQENEGNFDTAFKEYEQAIYLAEQLRAKIYFTPYRTGYFEKMQPLYESIVRLLLQNNLTDSTKVREAFHFMERFRARSFLESLSDKAKHETTVSPTLDSLIGLKDQAEQRWYQIQESENFFTKASNDSNRLARIQKKVKNEIRIRSLAYEIELKFSEISSPLKEMDVVLTLEEVQESIRTPDVFVLEYFLSEPLSFVWAISSTQIRIFQIPPRGQIHEQINILLNSVAYPEQRFSDLYEKSSRKLYEMLFQPLTSSVAPNCKLVIIPDGELAYLPFELLQAHDNFSMIPDRNTQFYEQSFHFLIERNPIVYAPSAGVFFSSEDRERSSSQHSRKLLIAGAPTHIAKIESGYSTQRSSSDFNNSRFMPPWENVKPLYYSAEEIESISKIFKPEQVQKIADGPASETRFKKYTQNERFQYIHLATHGFVNENAPQRTGLYLGPPDSLNDGFLRLPEISQLTLQSKLVVLSGCETGRGRLYHSNGVENLARAFISAGASAVIVSLWNVDDRSTSILMTHFYKNLIEDELKISEALTTAKADMLKSGEYSHPYFWAPFILMSNYD